MGAVVTASQSFARYAPQGAPGWPFPCARLVFFAALAVAAAACAVAQGSTAPAASDSNATLPAAASIHGLVVSTDGAVYEGARVVLESSGSAVLPPLPRPTATAHSAL